MKLIPALVLLLFAATVHAQDLPSKPEIENINDPNTIGPPAQKLISSNTPIPDEVVSKVYPQPPPDKPEPPPVHLGQWIAVGEIMGAFPDDLIITERKEDGRGMWHVEKVGSCAWCGRPMGWKE